MGRVEVLAVEVKQFSKAGGGELSALVPRLVGASESARRKKGSPTRRLTEQEFFATVTPAATRLFRKMFKEARRRGQIVYIGTSGFSIRAFSTKASSDTSFLYGYPPDLLQMYLHADWIHEPSEQELRAQLLEKGWLTENGRYTLSSKITDASVEALSDLVDLLFDQFEVHQQRVKESEPS